MSNGRGETRYVEAKRTYPKPIEHLGAGALDRERCVLCARCTRFSEQIAGDPFIALIERGALQQVGIYEKEPFESYFSGNTIQICRVGALTSASYRFRAPPLRPGLERVGLRALRLRVRAAHRPPSRQGHPPAGRRRAGGQRGVETATAVASGSCTPGSRTGSHTRSSVTRRTASSARPLDRGLRGRSRAACRRLRLCRGAHRRAADRRGRLRLLEVRAGGAGTNDIDFRARRALRRGGRLPRLARGRSLAGGDLRRPREGRKVVLVGFEPEDESADRLPPAAQGGAQGHQVLSVAPFTTRGLAKLRGTLIQAAPVTSRA